MVQAGLPGEVPSYAAWAEDGCQVEELSSEDPPNRVVTLQERRDAPSRLEALVDYFKRSGFLQDQARHLQLLEEEACNLRRELQRRSGQQAVPLAPCAKWETVSLEERNLEQETLLRYAANDTDPEPEAEARPSWRNAPKASELPSATRLHRMQQPRVSETSTVVEDYIETKVTEPPRISPASSDLRISRTDKTSPRKGNLFTEFFAETSSSKTRNSEREQGNAHTAVFADVEHLKEQVRKAIAEKPYRVEDLYKEEGIPQYIARSASFEMLTLAVIAINSIWIAIDIDLNTAPSILDSSIGFIIVENFFLTFFVFEWTMRFMAFKYKRNCLTDTWFVFDSFLVTLMFIDTYLLPLWLKITELKGAGDTSILKLVRMTRISRMARMAKLLKAFPELTILIKGIWVAARSVFFTLCLLTIIIYIFAVAFRQLTDDQEIGKMYFKTVPDSMKSLLLYGVLPDQAEIVTNIGNSHVILGILSLIFILLASLTVMNMLVGVLVEVVSVVSSVEKEELKVNFVKSRLRWMLINTGLDADHDMKISRKELDVLLMDPVAARIIKDVGVDPVGLVDFGDYIFQDSEGGLTFPQFIEVILQFRGSNNATVKDVVDLRKVALLKMVDIRTELDAQTALLKQLLAGEVRSSKMLSIGDKPSPPTVQRPGPPKLTIPQTMKVEKQGTVQE